MADQYTNDKPWWFSLVYVDKEHENGDVTIRVVKSFGDFEQAMKYAKKAPNLHIYRSQGHVPPTPGTELTVDWSDVGQTLIKVERRGLVHGKPSHIVPMKDEASAITHPERNEEPLD